MYWLGTSGRRERFQNPMDRGRVRVTSSGLGTGSESLLVARKRQAHCRVITLLDARRGRTVAPRRASRKRSPRRASRKRTRLTEASPRRASRKDAQRWYGLQACWSKDAPDAWLCLDLGRNRSLAPTHYTLCNGCGDAGMDLTTYALEGYDADRDAWVSLHKSAPPVLTSPWGVQTCAEIKVSRPRRFGAH